jgi:hypothetical protein
MGNTSNNTYGRFDEMYYGNKRIRKPCAKCGKDFKQGDEIFRKRTKYIKPYHRECWEKLLIA